MSFVKAVRPTGGIGAPGLDVTEDPGAPDQYANKVYCHFQLKRYLKKDSRREQGSATSNGTIYIFEI
jgi:hypothetical protein